MHPPSDDRYLDVDALGVTVRVEVGDLTRDERNRLREIWSGARHAGESTPAVSVAPQLADPFDASVAHLSTHVTLAALSAQKGTLWMLHAGAIADDDGRVVLFAGPSGMGKTTLMEHLARRYAYVTDESAGVAPDRSVLPYRKPLSVIAQPGLPKTQRSPSSLGLQPLPRRPLRLHAVVVLDRNDRVHPAVEALDDVEALDALAPHCSFLAEIPRPLTTVLGHLAAVGGAVRMRYSQATDVDHLVRDLFQRRQPRPVGATDLIDVDLRPAPPARGRFTRAPVVDAVRLDDDRLLLLRAGETENTLVVLGGVGPVLWRSAENATPETLYEAVRSSHASVAEHDIRAAVADAIEQMRQASLLHGPPPGELETGSSSRGATRS